MSIDAINSIDSALAGQTVLVVGGEHREEAMNRLRKSFPSVRFIHRPTRKCDASPRSFKSALDQTNLALAVCVLGLCRTHHSEYLHAECRRRDIPFIDSARIPHPNLLAYKTRRLRLMKELSGNGERQRR